MARRAGAGAATSTGTPRSSPGRTSCSSATGSRCCSTPGSFVEDGLLANASADDLPADGVVTGVGRGRRPAGVRHGQRPDGEGGIVGGAHGREDRAPDRARAARRAPGLLAGRLGRARASPTRSSCSPVVAAPGGSSTTRCGCRGGCRRSVACSARRPPAARTSRLLRHRDHGRGQRVDVPRLAADGRDGDRRDRARSRRWAAPACTRPCRAAATTSPSTTPTRSTQAQAYLTYFPQSWRARRRRTTRRRRRRGARPPTSCPTTTRRATTCTT